MMLPRDEALFAKLNSETARIGWGELQRHFAHGALIRVAQGQDLVEVAYAFASDDRPQVERLLTRALVAPASDDEARAWSECQAEFWAVVVAPWVLVQEIRPVSH